MADVNGDGLLDIFVCAIANMHGLKGHDELFINNGSGTFTESSQAYGLDFSGFRPRLFFLIMIMMATLTVLSLISQNILINI